MLVVCHRAGKIALLVCYGLLCYLFGSVDGALMGPYVFCSLME
jgi:hypothetical protein